MLHSWKSDTMILDTQEKVDSYNATHDFGLKMRLGDTVRVYERTPEERRDAT